MTLLVRTAIWVIASPGFLRASPLGHPRLSYAVPICVGLNRDVDGEILPKTQGIMV